MSVHFTGGPAIAVGNASQIKEDSMVSVGIALCLILLLLVLVFRSWKNLLLVLFSIAWGWLFGLGGLALFHDDVSIIVLGISSVILGIAVNYPLHLTAHLYHSSDVKSALREIVSPLVVGNVTTVGAFLCLVPLDSVALRDLGLFSSFLLVGTILFVLVFLPHLVRPHAPVHVAFLDRLSSVRLENNRIWIIVVCVLSLMFAYFSRFTGFDSDMSHINYMTEQQKADLECFKGDGGNAGSRSLYVVSSGDCLEELFAKALEEKEDSIWTPEVRCFID